MYAHIWAWAKNNFWDAWMLNTHYSIRLNVYFKKMVCLARKQKHTHTHTYATKCGTIILSNLLSRQILQIFAFSVYKCLHIVHMRVYLCARGVSFVQLPTHRHTFVTKIYTHTHTFHVWFHSKRFDAIYIYYIRMCVLSALRFVSFHIQYSLWNVYIERMCCVHLPSTDGKFLLSQQMK